MYNNVEIRHVMEHLEVYKDGKFLFSADNMREVEEELEELGL